MPRHMPDQERLCSNVKRERQLERNGSLDRSVGQLTTHLAALHGYHAQHWHPAVTDDDALCLMPFALANPEAC